MPVIDSPVFAPKFKANKLKSGTCDGCELKIPDLF